MSTIMSDEHSRGHVICQSPADRTIRTNTETYSWALLYNTVRPSWDCSTVYCSWSKEKYLIHVNLDCTSPLLLANVFSLFDAWINFSTESICRRSTRIFFSRTFLKESSHCESIYHILWYPRESSTLSSTETYATTCRFGACRAGLHIRQFLALLISLDSPHDLQHVADTLQELMPTTIMTLFTCSIFVSPPWLLQLGATSRMISVFLNNLSLELECQLIDDDALHRENMISADSSHTCRDSKLPHLNSRRWRLHSHCSARPSLNSFQCLLSASTFQVLTQGHCLIKMKSF